MKDDSGSYAVFTEQGSSASQMTAAKIMDIISRLPGCDGQAADAVSAYTQVKMEDAPTSLKNPKSECPDIRILLPKHKWPKSWSRWETQSFLLSEIYMVILWQDNRSNPIHQQKLAINIDVPIQTCIHTYIHTDRQTDRQTYGHTDGRTDGQTGRQTDIYIYIYIYTFVFEM